MSQLEWAYEDTGEWVAASNVISIDGDLACWRVRITESGEFSVMASDRELLDEAPPHFATLSLAKQYCEVAEAATETAIRNESKTSPGISAGTIIPLDVPQMSLRDWFAGQALSGILANINLVGTDSESQINSTVASAFLAANEALKARGQ